MTHEQTEDFKRILFKIRRPTLLAVGLGLFAVSLLLARNSMMEGLWFGLLGGVLVGPVMHYLLGKVLIPLGFGRVWCGWACWTAAILDQLPYRQSPSHLGLTWGSGRYVMFSLSLLLVLGLWFGLGYQAGALGHDAAYWFGFGNLLYWLVGVGLAVLLKDNRAFCKYVCPNPTIFKQTARFSLLKVTGDAQACQECVSQACIPMCPMDIRIPEYIKAGQRVLSTECIQCQACVCVCPPNTLRLSVGFDVGGLDLLQEQAFVEGWRSHFRRRKKPVRP